MKEDRKNLKEIFDLSLENIKVSEDLKRATMKKCAKQNTSWLKYTTISAAALLAVVILINNPFSHSAKPDINIALNRKADIVDQSPIIQSTAPEIQKSIEPPVPDQNIVQNKNVPKDVPQQIDTSSQENNNKGAAVDTPVNKPVNSPVSLENDTVQPKEESPIEVASVNQDNVNPTSVAVSPNRQNAISSTPDNGTAKSLGIVAPTVSIDNQLQTAKNFLNENLLLPVYIPEGFKLTSIYVSDENNKNGSYVELRYSFNESYFSVFEDKKLDMNFDDYTKITVNSIPAYIRVIPSKQFSEVVWLNNKIKYSISGNITEDTLVNIAKSLK